MSVETEMNTATRAIIRLRGYYALLAGALLLFVVPFYQLAVLTPSGYAAALAPAVDHRDFAPLLAWLANNLGASRGYRLLQLTPFLLALTFPRALALLVGVTSERRQLVMIWAGRTGFALFALALILGLFTSGGSAAVYANATTDAQRAAVAASYANAFAVETLLSHVAGGALLALFLALASYALRRTPAAFRLFCSFVAALLVMTALFYALAPGQVEAPASTLTLFGLALWFIALGLVFLRQTRPDAPAESLPTASAESEAAESDS
jgi:hypothetical protein